MENPVVYSKQPGASIIPLTVRIEWLPEGIIKPQMYWTPDGSCYGVRCLYESTPIAFLKDRGEGIRFKILAELTERSDAPAYVRHDTYLYLADCRFSERGFIDERYRHSRKRYVPVTLDVFPDGDYELVCFWVGKNRYMVEKTLEVKSHGTFYAGGIGIRHKIDVRFINSYDDEDSEPMKSVRRTATIFWELDKWFVAVNAKGE